MTGMKKEPCERFWVRPYSKFKDIYPDRCNFHIYITKTVTERRLIEEHKFPPEMPMSRNFLERLELQKTIYCSMSGFVCTHNDTEEGNKGLKFQEAFL